MMRTRRSQLQRAVDFFREGPFDEVRVAFQLVKEVVEERLAERKGLVKGQAQAVRRRRRAAAGENRPAAQAAAAGTSTAN